MIFSFKNFLHNIDHRKQTLIYRRGRGRKSEKSTTFMGSFCVTLQIMTKAKYTTEKKSIHTDDNQLLKCAVKTGNN